MNDSSRQYIYSTFNNEVMVIVYAYSSILAAIKISKIIKNDIIDIHFLVIAKIKNNLNR